MSKDSPQKTSGKKTVAKSKVPPGFIVVAVVIIASGLAAGIIAGVLSHRGGSDSVVKPPAFAYGPTTPRDAAKAYQFAIDRPDLLAQIPCYCGCGQDAGHTSNLDCFIKSRDGNDVIFDDHGAG